MAEAARIFRPQQVEARVPSVSAHSCWDSPQWRFDNPTAGSSISESTIRWDFRMPDGSLFTDPQWAKLLDECRCFVWSLLRNNWSGKLPKPGQMARFGVGLRRLVWWMAENDYADFSELGKAAMTDYIEDLVKETVNGDETLSAWSLLPCLEIPWHIYRQSPALKEAGVPVIPEHPYGGRSIREVASDLKVEMNRGTAIPPVPDEVFLPAVAEALGWLAEISKDILRLQDVYLNGVSGEGRGRYLEGRRAVLRQKAIEDFEFSVPAGRSAPWREPIKSSPRHRRFAKNGIEEVCLSSAGVVRALVTDLRNCCSMLVQALTGIRISEFCGLQSYPREKTTGLPFCVRIETSRSGLNEIFYIRGRLYKMREQWEEVTWVAGMRPKGTDYVPPPIQSILILDQLFEPWRSLGGKNELGRRIPKSGWVSCSRRSDSSDLRRLYAGGSEGLD